MKYPQLASMPASVQDWLDEQLESRGIDSVVYTRYILSLLQRDSLDSLDSADEVSPYRAKALGSRGSRRRRHRRQGCGVVWDCERLKRWSAVECLMSASDQKCGLEKLVDDLCLKLREMKSPAADSSSSVVLELSSSEVTSESPRDVARKYYAAFPPLGRASDARASPRQASVWTTKRASVWEEDKERNMNEVGREEAGMRRLYRRSPGLYDGEEEGNLARLIAKFDENIEALWSPSEADLPLDELPVDFSQLLSSPSPNEHSLVAELGDNKLNSFISLGTNITSSIWSDCTEDSLLEPDDGSHLLASGCGTAEGEARPAHLASGCGTAEGEATLAQLLSRDCGAVGSRFIPQATSYRTSDKKYDLLFPSLVDDPVERSNVAWNEAETLPSFFTGLPFGLSYALGDLTQDITSQKWSDYEGSNAMGGEVSPFGRILAENRSNFQRSLGLASSGGGFTALNRNREASSFAEVNHNRDSFVEVNHNRDSFVEVNHNRDTTSFAELNHNRDSFVEVNHNRDASSFVEVNHNRDASRFVEVNHNRDASSFVEVNHNRDSFAEPKQNYDDTQTAPDTIADSTKGGGSDREGEGEEEDLLTSTKTHFKPIKQENADSLGGNMRGYADGTTFVIPDGLEVLAFRRCQSGTLYLESDGRLEAPAKYREYKEKEPYAGRRRLDDADASEFVPKFRVCPNEKCCQTEEQHVATLEQHVATLDQRVATLDEGSVESVEPVATSLDDGWESSRAWRDDLKTCYKCNNNNNNSDWSVADRGEPRADIWSVLVGRRGTPCRDCSVPTKQHDRLREELSRDGEQLLSDLSYMQRLFLGSGWLDETPQGGWGEEEEGSRPSAVKFQCISPVGDVVPALGDEELVLYADDVTYSQSQPGKHVDAKSYAKSDAKSVDDFFSKCLLNVLPKTILLHADLEAEWKLNERPSNSKVNAKDRKRRHSACQRVASGEVASGEVASAVGLRSQTACVKGISCPQFILNHVRALRPVTL